nr:MAG TPA: Transcription initiation factor IIE, alpha FINGER, Transcription [Caudoviricetes sp.]
MKEYIERAAALDICQKEYEERLRMADYCGDTVAWNIGGAIKGIPAADVAEVRHGRWEQHLQSSKVAPVYTCSLCKLNVSGFEKRWIKYCPYCGARMEKEDEHEAD